MRQFLSEGRVLFVPAGYGAEDSLCASVEEDVTIRHGRACRRALRHHASGVDSRMGAPVLCDDCRYDGRRACRMACLQPVFLVRGLSYGQDIQDDQSRKERDSRRRELR